MIGESRKGPIEFGTEPEIAVRFDIEEDNPAVRPAEAQSISQGKAAHRAPFTLVGARPSTARRLTSLVGKTGKGFTDRKILAQAAHALCFDAGGAEINHIFLAFHDNTPCLRYKLQQF